MQDLTPLAARLAPEAGIGAAACRERSAAGSNANCVVTSKDGRRAVLRRSEDLPAPQARLRLRR
jgi:hypothetical protein